MFSISFPLGPLFSYINNLVEIRIDAFKVLTQYKRSLPKKAENIGYWLPILETVSILSIIVNVSWYIKEDLINLINILRHSRKNGNAPEIVSE